MNVFGFFLFASLARPLPTGSYLEFASFLVFFNADIESEENLNVAQEFFWVKISSWRPTTTISSKIYSARASKMSGAYLRRRVFHCGS